MRKQFVNDVVSAAIVGEALSLPPGAKHPFRGAEGASRQNGKKTIIYYLFTLISYLSPR